MACAFCLTGKMGLVRNLTAGEIAGQVRVLAARTRPARHALQHRADGHGRAAAQLRRDDEGAADSRRRARVRPSAARVTLSTVGCCRRSSGWRSEPSCRTSPSRCTRTTDEQRDAAGADQPQIRRRGAHRRVPTVPAASAAAASRSSTCCSRASTTRPRTRAGSCRLLTGMKAKVNLLPLNAAPGIPFERPSDARVDRVRADPGRTRRDRVGAEEPRPRHPRRVRSADHRIVEPAISGTAPRPADVGLTASSRSTRQPLRSQDR